MPPDPKKSDAAVAERPVLPLSALFGAAMDAEEVPSTVTMPPAHAPAKRAARTLPVPDLTGLKPMWITRGRGGTGKAQPLDSSVLTPTGFRKMGDLTVGDMVTCPDGTIAPIVGVYPQGEKDIYEIEFSDGRTVQCCDDHLWKIWVPGGIVETGKTHATRQRLASGSWRVESLAKIRSRLAAGELSPRAKRRAQEFAVPLVSHCAIELPPQDLAISPYALGALLGDGCLSQQNISFCSADQALVERLEAEMPDYKIRQSGWNKGYDYRIQMRPEFKAKLKYNEIERMNKQNGETFPFEVVLVSSQGGLRRRVNVKNKEGGAVKIEYNGISKTVSEWANFIGSYPNMLLARLAQMPVEQALGFAPLSATKNVRAYASPLVIELRRLGLHGCRSDKKFIPPQYKIGSVSQRLALLQGLFDTDGSVDNACATLTSTSERLINDVREIAWSLGAIAKVAKRQTYFTHKGERRPGKPSWRLIITVPDVSQYFSLPRKVERCAPKNMKHRLRIISVKPIGRKPAQCIAVDHPDHLYVTDNFVVTHNTMFARWMASELFEREISQVVLAALDPGLRLLAEFAEVVMQPKSTDPRETLAWLREFFGQVRQHRACGVVDTGGGDVAFPAYLRMAKDFAPDMEEAGVAIVAAYFFSTAPDDPALLAADVAVGFQPRATALVLNQNLADGPGAYDAVRAHPAYKEALARGAVEVVVPRLEPQKLANRIEGRRFHFYQARDGIVPEGSPHKAIDAGLDRVIIRGWLEAMEEETRAIRQAGWMPWGG